jgi:LmeA-like phospholipid-binding
MGLAARIAAAVAAVLVLLLALAQLLLPRIAAGVISSRIKRYGDVSSVQVSAWPAIKLLWSRADSVSVRAGHLRLDPSQGAALAWQARHTGRVEFAAASVQLGRLHLTHVRLDKRGDALRAEARASAADVAAALPAGLSVELVGSEDGRVTVRTGGALFGVGTALTAVASASEGRLVVRPTPLSRRALQLTLFADAHVRVLGVAARAERGQPPRGYALSMWGTLR